MSNQSSIHRLDETGLTWRASETTNAPDLLRHVAAWLERRSVRLHHMDVRTVQDPEFGEMLVATFQVKAGHELRT